MQIFVDADACPVVGIVEKVAKEHDLPVTLLCDTNHVLSSDYSEVIVVGAGADAVDYKLISICHKGDIVVSQDYGVAAMALGKAAYAIHQSGKWYTNENIDQILMERHLNKKITHDWYHTTTLQEHCALLQLFQQYQLPDRHLHQQKSAYLLL